MDAPKNLSVPGVSDSAIPSWNIRSDNYFEALFSFAQSNLHDDAVVLIIHSAKPQVLKDLREWAFEFGYDQVRDWWGLNNLLLASPSPVDEFRVGIHILFFFLFLFQTSICSSFC